MVFGAMPGGKSKAGREGVDSAAAAGTLSRRAADAAASARCNTSLSQVTVVAENHLAEGEDSVKYLSTFQAIKRIVAAEVRSDYHT